jgi:phage tail tape measure protein, TP901 family, core region
MSENVGGIEYDVRFNTGELIDGRRSIDREVNAAGKSFEGLTKQANVLAASIAGIFAVGALVAQLKAASDAARLFERGLSNLSALTGATGKDLVFFGDAAKELGLKYGKSASEIVEAMKLIGSTKPELLENKEALKEVTDQVLTLAKAATIGAPEAAAALTSALNQFGEGANKAGEFINIMAAGAQQGTAEIVQVNEALKNAGATANAVGISFSDVNAAIQGLAKGAIVGSEAGTALKSVLLKLENDANTKLKPSVNGLSGAINNLAKENLSIAELTKKFGLENVNAALTLIAQKDVVDKLSISLVGTSSAYDQAKTNSDNFQGSMDKLKASFDQMQIAIGENLNPSLRVFADALTAALTGKVEAGSALEKVLLGIELAALSLGAVVASRLIVAMTAWGASMVAAGTSTLLAVPAVIGMSAVLGTQASAATASTIATNALTATMLGLRTAMAFLGGPLGIIALASVAMFEFQKNIDKKKADEYAESIGRVEKAFRSLNAAARSATLAEINMQMDSLIAKQKAQDAIVKNKAGKVGGVLGTSAGEITATAEAGKTAAQIEALAGQKANLLKVNQELIDQEKKSLEPEPAKPKRVINSGSVDGEDSAKKLAMQQEKGYQELLRLRSSAATGLAKIDAQELDELDKVNKLKFKNTEQYEEAKFLVAQKYAQDRVAFLESESDKEVAIQEKVQAANLEARNKTIDVTTKFRGLDPVTALEDEYKAKLAIVNQYEAKMAADGVNASAEATATKLQIETDYNVAKQDLAIQTWGKQSEINQFTLDALDAFGSASSSAIEGLLTGTMSAQDAMRSLASSILDEAVGALVQMGVQYVKNQIIQQTADQAVTATKLAAIATTTTTQVAATGTMAAASTAAAGAVAAAAAPAAGLMSIATLGKAALIGGAALVGTMALAKSFGGGRRYGGAVNSDSMYRVNESGAPEMFTANNGAQYMMPTSNGNVTPANQVGGGSGGVTINISNYTGADVQATTSPDGKMIEIAVRQAVQAVGDGLRSNTGPAWDGLKAGSNAQSKL